MESMAVRSTTCLHRERAWVKAVCQSGGRGRGWRGFFYMLSDGYSADCAIWAVSGSPRKPGRPTPDAPLRSLRATAKPADSGGRPPEVASRQRESTVVCCSQIWYLDVRHRLRRPERLPPLAPHHPPPRASSTTLTQPANRRCRGGKSPEQYLSPQAEAEVAIRAAAALPVPRPPPCPYAPAR